MCGVSAMRVQEQQSKQPGQALCSCVCACAFVSSSFLFPRSSPLDCDAV